MKAVFLFFPLILFAFSNIGEITNINEIMKVYQNRLNCLKSHEPTHCIERYPLDPRNDALDKTFSMSFPKAYYRAKLKRDLKYLERRKLCYGRSLDERELKECLKSLR